MRRSLTAVVLGTFTLRFGTGLTGALLVHHPGWLRDSEHLVAPSTTPLTEAAA